MKSSIKLHPGRWALGLIALMTMALVACGGAEAPTAAPTVPTPTVVDVIPAVPAIKDTPVPQAQATEAMAATEVPAAVSARDTVIIVSNEEPLALGYSGGGCQGNIQSTACEEMIGEPFTWIDNKTFEVVPLSHIEGWEQVAPDRWRFNLREGVKFHNGVPWDSAQAKFWLDWSGDEETAGNEGSNSFGFHGVIGGEVVDPLTVDITCGKACPILPRTLIFTKVTEMGWWQAASEDEKVSNNIGLGPYKLVDWKRGVQVELEIYEDYKPNKAFAAQAPIIQNVRQVWRTEALVRAAMLEAGEADWAEISLDDRNRVPKHVVGTNNEAYLFVIDTVHHPELRKKDVREALTLAVDCETLMEQIFDDLFKCFTAMAQMGTEGITAENSRGYDFDPNRARELLKQANYNPENVIKLHMRNQRIPKDTEYGEAVVTYWKEVGINAELHVVESSVHTNIGRSNCGHGRTKTDFENAAGDGLLEKCRSLGPGKTTFQSMHLTAPATSTESLDFASRQGRLRLSCFGRSSGVCDNTLQAMTDACVVVNFGPERVTCNTEIADYVRDNFLVYGNFVNVAVYGLSADLEWDPYYSPRIRANTLRFTK
ncbi:MAG: ABC transporter substrate-binding protein [Dehalococcoidia bacterium]|nr:ABC transporter substrate-binding protein [Dehalococcoidia bacterium]